MKLLKLYIGESFRSLHRGFSLEFHKLDDKGIDAMKEFQPFCFAGLNGSGKSNVLEALAAIFYHLECCVAKFKPKSFDKFFKPEICTPDVFTLEYLIDPQDKDINPDILFDKITIEKCKGELPRMFRQKQIDKFIFSEEKLEVSLEPTKSTSLIEPAAGKAYLPDIVVGYSSGENEILSLPFIKNRLIHYDEYKEAVVKQLNYEEPESSLTYIDSGMSQAVLLSILLFENNEALKPLEDELGIVGLRSFRMNLNTHAILFDKHSNELDVSILHQLSAKIHLLKRCATSFFQYGETDGVLWLDFYVNDATKQAFKENFGTSFKLFRLLQILYDLNAIKIDERIKEEVYQSKGFYTDGKLPVPSPAESVFFFLDFMILKKIKGIVEPKELLLREFSDGEHQFLHTMGICLMLKERRSILLLDEPETHLNPGWRAKFIKVLNDSIASGGGNNLLRDIILTSHSPFIISDCLSNNVVFFKRNETTHLVEAKTASQLGIKTFGASVEIILDELFNYNQSIGDMANAVYESINFDTIESKEEVQQIKKSFNYLGESIEKDLILSKLNKLKFSTETDATPL